MMSFSCMTGLPPASHVHPTLGSLGFHSSSILKMQYKKYSSVVMRLWIAGNKYHRVFRSTNYIVSFKILCPNLRNCSSSLRPWANGFVCGEIPSVKDGYCSSCDLLLFHFRCGKIYSVQHIPRSRKNLGWVNRAERGTLYSQCTGEEEEEEVQNIA